MKFFITIFFTLLLSACADFANVMDLEGKFEKKEVKYAQISLCYKVYPTAYAAIENKQSGTTKKELLAALPSRSELEAYPVSRNAEKRLGLAKLDITEQVYKYKNLDPQAYSAFSAELCQRKLFGKQVPENFKSIYPKLLKCNSLAEPQQRINCGMAIAGS